jgi:Rps23 Pro-64 3,4-dihydroxylase Tpa1-like proline 4-hydroxylase
MLAAAAHTDASSPDTEAVAATTMAGAALASLEKVFNLPEAGSVAQAYREALPYPHLVIDNFFYETVLEQISKEVVGEKVNFNKVFTDAYQRNKTISTGDAVPPLINIIASKFAASGMLRYLEKVTGLRCLIPDPHYNADYGYYHIVGAGGVLGSHVDHSRHNTLHVPHVLNLVVYLSKNWNEKEGGALCLYDETGTRIVKRVACRYNRAIIFACTPTAYHGVDPIIESASRRRHSLYFAYYTVEGAGAGSGEQFPHLQQGKTNADEGVSYGTYFVVPLRDLFKRENWVHLRMRLVYFVHLVTPPILVRALRRLAKALR